MVLLGPEKTKISTPADFPKYKIGVPRASTTDIGVMKVAPAGTDIRRFDDDASALQAVIVGQIDAAGTSSVRSEEHTSELQSLMRISYAVFCLKKKKEQERVRTRST